MTRVPTIVPLPRAPQVPSQSENSIVGAQRLIAQAAQTGTGLARLSQIGSRRERQMVEVQTREQVAQQTLETFAAQVETEELRRETIKQRVLTDKAKKQIEDLTIVEDDGFTGLMAQMSKEELNDFIQTYRFLDKRKQSEVERYLGRQFGQQHLTEVVQEFTEFVSDPQNDPRDFSLTDRLTTKLVEAQLTPGAHIAHQNYTLPQIGGMQRNQMTQFAAMRKAEVTRHTRSQLIEGFGSYLMSDTDPDSGAMLLLELGKTASELSVDGSAQTAHNELMRASTVTIKNHLEAGTDPTKMLDQLNALKGTIPSLYEGLVETGAIQQVQQEILNRESRAVKAELGEMQKRIVIAGQGRGNAPALQTMIDELAQIDTSDMSQNAAKAVKSRVGTMIFDAKSRQRQIEMERGEYNTIMLNIGSGSRLEPGKAANPKVVDQVFEDLIAFQVGNVPEITAQFVRDGYGIPNASMVILKADLNVNVGGGNLERAYATWKAISAVDEDLATSLLTADKIKGMTFLRRLVNWTNQAEPDTDTVNEVLALAQSGAFMRIQTTTPPQAGETGSIFRYAANVYQQDKRAINTLEVQQALDLDGQPPQHVLDFYMDSFAFRNTLIQMNDLNDSADMAAMDLQSMNEAQADLRAEFHVLRPDGAEISIVEARMFPGIAQSPVVEQAVNEGVRTIQDKLDATVQFNVPVKIAGERRWWPVVADDPGFDPSRNGIKAFIEWDTTSNSFQVIERHNNEEIFDAGVSRILRGHTARDMNPITRLQRRQGEPQTIGQLDFNSSRGRGMQVLGVIERSWDRTHNDVFDVGTPEGARFAERFAKEQLGFPGGFGTTMVNRNDPLLIGGAVR